MATIYIKAPSWEQMLDMAIRDKNWKLVEMLRTPCKTLDLIKNAAEEGKKEFIIKLEQGENALDYEVK